MRNDVDGWFKRTFVEEVLSNKKRKNSYFLVNVGRVVDDDKRA